MSLANRIGDFYMRHITTDKVSEKKILKSISLYHTKGSFLYNFNKLRALLLWDKIQRKYGCNIYPGITVGENLHIIHPNGIIIGKTTKIGDNCTIFAHTIVISKAKAPSDVARHAVIGNDVILGARCTIIGTISIGNDCVIGAGAIVTKDIPSHSIVTGINHIRRKRPEEINKKYQRESSLSVETLNEEI